MLHNDVASYLKIEPKINKQCGDVVMVKRLSDLLNDSETLSELEPEDLAELILEDLIDREKTINSDFH